MAICSNIIKLYIFNIWSFVTSRKLLKKKKKKNTVLCSYAWTVSSWLRATKQWLWKSSLSTPSFNKRLSHTEGRTALVTESVLKSLQSRRGERNMLYKWEYKVIWDNWDLIQIQWEPGRREEIPLLQRKLSFISSSRTRFESPLKRVCLVYISGSK